MNARFAVQNLWISQPSYASHYAIIFNPALATVVDDEHRHERGSKRQTVNGL
jgi:hypothetical protein